MTSNDINIVLRGQTDMRHRQHDLAGRVATGQALYGRRFHGFFGRHISRRDGV